MFTAEQLDVTLITFNRKPFLEETLKKIFADDSPIKNCSVTVYDNHSNDGSKEVLEEYASRYANLKPVFSPRNIGLSGNICKALINSSKEYVWILCDNDEIKWENWSGVEKGLQEGHDIVLASRFYIPSGCKISVGQKLAQLTFLPSGIYKTKYLTDFVTAWMVNDTFTVLPHLVLACQIVNEGADIYVPEKSVVLMKENPELQADKILEKAETLDRTGSKKRHPKANFYCFESCEVNACSILDNKQYCREMIDAFSDINKRNGWGPGFLTKRALRWYVKGEIAWSNLMDIYPILTGKEKCQFWCHYIRYFLKYKIFRCK